MKKSGRENRTAAFLVYGFAMLISIFMTTGVLTPTPASASGTIATCGDCHGNPPVDDAIRNSTTGRFRGSHNKHTVSVSLACTVCHIDNGAALNHRDGYINMANPINATVAAAYSKGTSSFPQSSAVFVAGTCSNVYCHGSFVNSAGTDTTPDWGATAPCGSCHGATANTPPMGGSHVKHAGSADRNLLCIKCHGPVAGGTGHMNSSVTWTIDTADKQFGTKAKYRGLAAGSTGTRATVLAYGSCTEIYCHGTVQGSGGTTAGTYTTATWGNAGSFPCGSCHANPNTSGTHTVHTLTPYSYVCDTCHNTGGYDNKPNHANGLINMGFSTTAGVSAAYTQGTHTPAQGGYGACMNTKCHGTLTSSGATTMLWNAGKGSIDHCTLCHGLQTTATDKTAAEHLRAPGSTNGTGADTAGHTAATDKQVGAHYVHLGTGTQTIARYSSAIACSSCHAVPANVTTTGHIDTLLPAEITFSGLAVTGSATPTYNSTTGQCTNVYCHGKGMPAGSAPAISNATVTWNDTAYLVSTPSVTGDCDKCHLSPPSTGAHGGGETISMCNGCHSHVATNGTFSDVTKHVNGVLNAAGGDCTSCHNTTRGTSPVRRATVLEFGLAYGHMKSGRGAVTKFDCGVCHMEGDASTGAINLTYHNATAGDGKIDLRDPDAGTAMSLPTGTSFRRNLGSNTIESIATTVQDFCLKCHDAGGAGHTSARVSGGTATNPWNDGATVVNVYSQLATTNTSFHPVRGVQNNAFCDVDTMESPWNVPNGTHKQITCFDCHVASGLTSSQTATYTVSAHGNAVTLRASITVAATGTATPLCVVCHKTTIYWGANIHSGTGSAFSGFTEGRHQPADHWGCTSCHGVDNYNSAAGTQATRAEAAHGFNTAGEYSFLRGSSGSKFTWDSTNPRTTCDGMNCGTGRSDSGMTYSPGGTY